MVTTAIESGNKSGIVLLDSHYQQDVFGTQLVVSEDDISNLSGSSQLFRSWAFSTLGDGLNELISLAIHRELASNAQEALKLLADISRGCPLDKLTITQGDHGGSGRFLSKLNRRLQGPSNETVRNLQMFGSEAHFLFLNSCAGRDYEPKEALNVANALKAGQQLLFAEKEWSSLTRDDSFIPRGESLPVDPTSVKKVWQSGVKELKEQDPDIERRTLGSFGIVGNNHELRETLIDLLKPQFGSLLSRLPHNEDGVSRYITLQTLMSLASAVGHMEELGMANAVFPEIRPLNPKWGLSGGEIDAVVVHSIKGRAPSEGEIALLKDLALQSFPSFESLLGKIFEVYGEEVEVLFKELKFKHGDGGPNKPIDMAQVRERPRAKDINQVERYLTLAPVGHHFHSGRKSDLASVWHESHWLSGGEVIYISPFEAPIVHKVDKNPDRHSMLYTAEVMGKADHLMWQAKKRMMGNWIAGRVADLVNGGSSDTIRRKTWQLPFQNLEVAKPIIELAKNAQPYADTKTQLVRIIGKMGKGLRYGLVLDKVIQAEGWAKDFKLTHMTQISCPFPGHPGDDTPSFSLYPGREDKGPHFHCFGCGKHGEIITGNGDEIWDVFHGRGNGKNHKGHKSHKLEPLVVPVEQTKINWDAQEILQDTLSNTKRGRSGREYLNKRMIDYALAFSLGAGLGSNALINGLLDKGHTYDELLKYGFCRLSSYPKEGLTSLFKARGLSLDEIKRPIRNRTTKQIEDGYPYNVLDRRLTFILGFPVGKNPQTNQTEIIPTNFYGRAIWEGASKRSAHRKLFVGDTGVAQGGFNMQALGLDYPLIRVEEGVFDALTLIQLGFPSTMAIVGTGNQRIMQSIVEFGKQVVALGLDNDAPGRLNEMRLRQGLPELGFKGSIIDFTTRFRSVIDRVHLYKDPNAWLIDGRGGEVDLASAVRFFGDPGDALAFYELDLKDNLEPDLILPEYL